MNDGVKILLDRMETHPEEFVYRANEGAGKWGRLLENFKHCFTNEEITAVEEGIKNIERTRFTELVLEELVDPKKSSLEDVINQYRVKGMPSVGQIPAISSVALYPNGVGGNATLLAQQKLQAEHIKAHVEALQVEDRTKLLNKRATTIFGKLFNYS